jgi:molecular chaperone HtpG
MNWEHLDELKELLRFRSTKTEGDALVSLTEYIDRMPENQKEIYYLIGDNKDTIQGNPLLETFRAKGFEVLLLSDPIDEFMMSSLTEYKEKKFHDLAVAMLNSIKLKKKRKLKKNQRVHLKVSAKRFRKLWIPI